MIMVTDDDYLSMVVGVNEALKFIIRIELILR